MANLVFTTDSGDLASRLATARMVDAPLLPRGRPVERRHAHARAARELRVGSDAATG